MQPVTAIYDLGRHQFDGRRFEQYLSWLSESVQAFPEALIFTDSDRLVQSLPSENIYYLPRQELRLWRLESEVTTLLMQPSSHRDSCTDLTCQLATYALLMLSKFQFLRLAADSSGAEMLLWVDAGISRFMPKGRRFSPQYPSWLGDSDYEGFFLADTRDMNLRKSSQSRRMTFVGSHQRRVAGAVFLLSARLAQHLERRAQLWALRNLQTTIWDNEQVFLASEAPKLGERIFFLPQKNDNPIGDILPFIFSEKPRLGWRSRLGSWSIQRRLDLLSVRSRPSC